MKSANLKLAASVCCGGVGRFVASRAAISSNTKSILASVDTNNFVVHNAHRWPTQLLTATLRSLTLHERFINEQEEHDLLEDVAVPLKRLRYEQSHWDDAIHKYRETERSRWSRSCQRTIDRIRRHSFPSDVQLLSFVHVLDLHKDGYIKPHVDSTRYCGRTISGVSLLSDAVMRLRHVELDECVLDMRLPRRSLYVMTDESRHVFTHEVLRDAESQFNGRRVPRARRISIICRDLPAPSADVVDNPVRLVKT